MEALVTTLYYLGRIGYTVQMRMIPKKKDLHNLAGISLNRPLSFDDVYLCYTSHTRQSNPLTSNWYSADNAQVLTMVDEHPSLCSIQ